LAALDAHHAVLHQVDAAHAVATGDLADSSDQFRGGERLVIDANGPAPLEGDAHSFRLVRRVGHGARPREAVLGGLGGGILEDAALDAPTPEILVDAVGRAPRYADGDAVLLRVGDRRIAVEVVIALGRH